MSITSILLLPLLASILLFFIKGKMGFYLAISSSVITLLCTIYLFSQWNPNGLQQFEENYVWLINTHASFGFALDGWGMLMFGLTSLLVPIIILSASEDKRPSHFFALILLMQFSLLGVFSTNDALLFYLFWEACLIPIWFLCGLFGKGKKKHKVFLKFFTYTFIGSLFMLIGILYLYALTPGEGSFQFYALYLSQLTPNQQVLIFWLFFIAFAIKLPLFPFHTWQPDTYKMAPTQGSMLLSGLMLKMAIYGIVKILIPVTPLAIKGWSGELVLILAIIGIIYASFIAITNKNIKKIIAYSSIAHVGLITAGIFAAARVSIDCGLNMEALQGVAIQSFAHGINAVGLFYAADILIKKYHSSSLKNMSGLASKAPVFAVLFFIIVAGAMAVPLTNSFIGEFLLLKGLFNYNTIAACIAGFTVIFCAIYMLRFYNKSMFGTPKASIHLATPISAIQTLGLGIIAGGIIFLGLFPKYILNLTKDTFEVLLTGF